MDASGAGTRAGRRAAVVALSALGVIPARGGSKGVPRKNVKPLAGEPLVVYTIRSARAAKSLARVVVSTDSDEIARVAGEAGAEVVMRPAELAADDSPTEDALIHVLETIEGRGEALPDYVATLEPTSPFRTPALIDSCVELALAKDADAVITVAESHESWGRLEDGRFRYLEPGQPRRRQSREPLYRESSTVYVTRTASLRANRSVLAEPLYAVVASEEEAIDINTPLDFEIAEAIMRRRKEAAR